MNTIKEFITFTNLKSNRIRLSLLLIVSSILYCVVLSLVHTLIYMGNPFYYYAALYVFVVWAAYVYMIIVFQFIQKKRDMQEKLQLRSYILPLLGVQTIFYVVMIAASLMRFTMTSDSSNTLYYILTPICILLTIGYIPLQVFSFIAIYDGVRNPFKIIYTAFLKMMKHYRSCFYALLLLAMGLMLYHIIMNVCFGISNTFYAFDAVQDIMVQSNPFVNTISYLVFAFQNDALWPVVFVSFLYGVGMCVLLVYYYMLMICIHDEDIKV